MIKQLDLQFTRRVQAWKKFQRRKVFSMSSSTQLFDSYTVTRKTIEHKEIVQQQISSQELEQLHVDYEMSAAFKGQQQDGPPRLFNPLIPWMMYKNVQDLPVMIFLPGIDGTGFGAYRQFSRLAEMFDLSILLTPTSDRTPFQEQVAIVKEYLVLEAQRSSISRPIYLFGESYGTLLAMAVAVECSDLVDRIILVNPASGFPRTYWKQMAPLLAIIPQQMYEYFPYMMLPLFSNAVAVISHRVDQKSSPLQQLSQLAQGMVEQLPELEALKLLLPHDCLMWKIQLVEVGCKHMEEVGYKNVLQRTLVVTADQDILVPAREEGERLAKVLPRAKIVNLANRAHAVLLEAGVDLTNIIKENGFYTEERNMTSSFSDTRKGNYFGTAGPIELPTAQELKQEMEGGSNKIISLANLKRIVSPVFLSTDNHGRISLGLDNIERRSGKGILFVGNHQFMGLDLGLLVAELLQEQGILVRGLTHPILYVQGETSDFIPIRQLTTYGAVQTNPDNMYSLLEQGEAIMLFPGGAPEALKGSELKYELMWPEQGEFVRMAAKFGATIVPFSSCGLEDSITQIMSAEDILKLPIIGEYLKSQVDQLGRQGNINPRKWQGRNKHISENLSMPIALPAIPPSRFYIKFGQPILTKEEWVGDKEKCEKIYREVQQSVTDGLVYLQNKRQVDPYKDIISRLIFEASWNFQQQAPTFKP